jgi:cobalt-zinc-cadmium efflux system membrane fusion protein
MPRAWMLFVALVGCGTHQAPVDRAAPPAGEVWLTPAQVASMQLGLARVSERPIEDTVATGGRLAFDDMRVTHVMSPLTGRVTQVFADLGARVKKGEPLATITSPELGLATAEAQKSTADLRVAKDDFDRKTELWKYRACSQAELQAAEGVYRRALAEAERANQKLGFLGAQGRELTQTFTLRAPMDGEVLARAVSPGLEVAGLATPDLFVIGEIDRVWAWADLYELDISRVHAGARAMVTVAAFPDATFEGTVDFVSRSLEPGTRTAKLRIALPNPDGLLKPEMYARVHVVATARHALAVRRTALLRLGDQSFVFAHTGPTADGRERFERRHVIVDEAISDDWAPLEHGLSAGDEIVENGALLLTASGT